MIELMSIALQWQKPNIAPPQPPVAIVRRYRPKVDRLAPRRTEAGGTR